jgi:hypothetical protein
MSAAALKGAYNQLRKLHPDRLKLKAALQEVNAAILEQSLNQPEHVTEFQVPCCGGTIVVGQVKLTNFETALPGAHALLSHAADCHACNGGDAGR